MDPKNRSGGYLIKHNGFDEVLYLLGDIFDYRLPSKEDFICDAERRYKMLSDSIDGFTEITSVDEKMNEEKNDAAGDEQYETIEVKQAVQNITSQAELQNLFREAVTLFSKGKYWEAVGVLKKLTEKDSQNARYHAWLGLALCEQGRHEEALEETQKASELEPDNARFRKSLRETLGILRLGLL